MALTNKLRQIGDAIRDSLGESESYTLDEMPDKIRSIEGGDPGWKRPADWPDLTAIDLSKYPKSTFFTVEYINGAINNFSILGVVSSGLIIIESGYIVGDTFVSETSATFKSNSNYIASINSNRKYHVFRVYSELSSAKMTKIGFTGNTFNGIAANTESYRVLELVWDAADITTISPRPYNRHTRQITIHNMTKTTVFDRMFVNDSVLYRLDFYNCDFSNATSFNSMFYGLTSLKYGNFMNALDLSSAVNISQMFYGSSAIEYVDFSKYTLSGCNITQFAGVFRGAKVIKFPTVTGFTGTISNLVTGTSNLEELDMSGIDVSQTVPGTNDQIVLFSGTTKLRKLKMPRGIKAPTVIFTGLGVATKEVMDEVIASLATLDESEEYKVQLPGEAAMVTDVDAITAKGWTYEFKNA